jgi:uncharacterized protein with PIN domain
MTPREIMVEAMHEMSRKGESHEMCARWISERLTKQGYQIVKKCGHEELQIEGEFYRCCHCNALLRRATNEELDAAGEELARSITGKA